MKNKETFVILNPERSERVSRSHITSVELVDDEVSTKQRYALKRSFLLRASACFGHSFSSGSPRDAVASLLAEKLRPSSTNNILRLFVFLRRGFRYAQPLKMTFSVLILAVFLSIGIISESRAKCKYSICYDTWNPGVPDNCGDGCTYDFANGKLTVTATKTDATIPKGMFSPYYYEDNVFPKVTNIEIAGEFKNIESNAFVGNGTTISGKDGVLYLNGVEAHTFNGCTLKGTIIIGDNQVISTNHWYSTNLNGTVILPPTIKISPWALAGLHLGEHAKIYCGAENCEELFRNVNCDSIGGSSKASCQQHLATLLSSGKLLPYPDGCTKMNASGCIKCKNENFKLNDGECDRIRYTPAEAAAAMNGDDNTITITFKK